jgi:putative addiction module component (TIGR02574 family)
VGGAHIGERLELIEQIWDTLPERVIVDELPAWHLDELAKRRAEAEVAPGVGTEWREVLKKFGSGE